ncbi:MAG: polysaccharide deacetylase family protein [Tannerellaceae bacterium]|nr:polysaccharide deacetylase family protein [Tannerellaceae bacterium]
METNDIVRYITGFLLGDEADAAISLVGYTGDAKMFERYALVIVPSGFFDKGMYGAPASIPAMPLKRIEGLPFLFGKMKEETAGNTQVIYADLIASAYFLVSRYEEMVRRDVRDVHGRFPGRESVPFKANFIHRPLLDEYRLLIRRRLGLPAPQEGIKRIFLTHDIDAPFLYRSWKGVMRSIRDKRGVVRSIRDKYGRMEDDPYYTFPRIFEKDSLAKEKSANVSSIFFLKGGGGRKAEDKPRYSLKSRDIRKLAGDIIANGASIGLHASYEAGINSSLIRKEKENIEQSLGVSVSCNRHHFLASREPEDMDCLEAAGISDDFTLGYADVAGFRLGTCHPVRRINPVTRRLTSLRLHPLTVMDCTLNDGKYMGLSYQAASAYCLRLIQETERMGGEVSLLWHNTSMREDVPRNYLHTLYTFLLDNLTGQADDR